MLAVVVAVVASATTAHNHVVVAAVVLVVAMPLAAADCVGLDLELDRRVQHRASMMALRSYRAATKRQSQIVPLNHFPLARYKVAAWAAPVGPIALAGQNSVHHLAASSLVTTVDL